ncbi:MAG: PAS domain-containing sensor histidine kinase [Silvibacterium sp.]|nr:PAS domain-containing sensor histidine kinase [Silvibacterium sp.]MBV8438844.1 PAS domain-containing sensor histidine kinase [Silvibacterium sp.]
MRLKTKIALAIGVLVFLVATALSWVYLNQLLKQQIDLTYDSARLIAEQLLGVTRTAIQTGVPQDVNAHDPEAVRKAVAAALHKDEALNELILSILGHTNTVSDIEIVDNDGKALLTTLGKDQQPSKGFDFASLQGNSLIGKLKVIFGKPQVYDVTTSLDRDGKPFLTIRVGIKTLFLGRFEVIPLLSGALTYIAVGILISLLAAGFVSKLALRPLEQISSRLDALEQVEAGAAAEIEAGRSSDAVVQVSHKIERLGRRMKNVEEVFSALKENIDQILSNLQDGIMLFTRDSRAVLVSRSMERFLDVSRDQLLGAEVHEIFDRNSLLGRTVRQAFDAGMSIVQEEITTEAGRRLELSLDLIHDDQIDSGRSLGALLTLHDVESVSEIESELELSRRMAAIGRLTSGVGHEVKNPINSIVVHLELLRSKVGGEPTAARHLEIIQSEIQRLDRVVQTLVDFSRPVELKLRDHDMRQIVSSVLLLASAGLESYNVTVVSQLPDHPIMVKVDADLLKQALLNVVLNGAQAMADGGELSVRLTEDGRWATIKVQDHGEGIPEEIRSKIFDLYFTTKREGSGIGLAMTYRILQLHHGQLDVESKLGEGSTFTLSVPTSGLTDPRLRGVLEANSLVVEERRG